MPINSKQTAYNVRKDTKLLARTFGRHLRWPSVYDELARASATHSAQSWRNFHKKNSKRVQTLVDRYKARRSTGENADNGSTTEGSDDDDDAPPPPPVVKNANVPARGGKGKAPAAKKKKYVPPSVHDFGTSSEESSEEEAPKKAPSGSKAKSRVQESESSDGEEEEQVDELESQPSPPKRTTRSAKAKGKQRAVVPESESQESPPKGYVEDDPPPRLGRYADASTSKARQPFRQETPVDDQGGERDNFVWDSLPPRNARHTEPLPKPKLEKERTPKPARRSLPEASMGPVLDSPLVVLDKHGNVRVHAVDLAVSRDAEGRIHVNLSPKQQASPGRRSPVKSPTKKRPLEEEEDSDSDSDSDSDDDLGAETQALAARFNLPTTSRNRSASNDSNSSDFIQNAIVPPVAKKARTSPLKEVQGSQEQESQEQSTQESMHSVAKEVGPPEASSSSKSPARRAPTVQPDIPPRPVEATVEPAAAAAAAAAARPARAVQYVDMSGSDRRALHGLVLMAKARGFANAQMFRAYFACSGDNKVLDVLAVPEAERTPAHWRILEQGYWTEAEDKVVREGSKQEQDELEQVHGQHSVDYRRSFLEALGQASKEAW